MITNERIFKLATHYCLTKVDEHEQEVTYLFDGCELVLFAQANLEEANAESDISDALLASANSRCDELLAALKLARECVLTFADLDEIDNLIAKVEQSK